MSFNRDNVAAVRRKYENLHFEAEAAADARREELHRKIPGLEAMDRKIAATGPRLMAIVLHQSNETTEQVREDVKGMRAKRAEMLKAYGYPEDYSDVHYICPKCSDTGFEDGKMCSCMRRDLIMAGYRTSGIEGLMKQCSFDNFSLEFYRSDRDCFENMNRVFNIVKKYAEDFTLSSPSLLFIGNTGLGKTHLSVALASALIEKGVDVLYTGAVGMFSDFEAARFRTSTGTESGNSTQRYFDSELLIIDDLGAEMPSQFSVSCLYDLLNRRKMQGLPTVINTNLNYTELGTRYTDRIVSRIFGEFRPLKFSGVDVRRQKLTV